MAPRFRLGAVYAWEDQLVTLKLNGTVTPKVTEVLSHPRATSTCSFSESSFVSLGIFGESLCGENNRGNVLHALRLHLVQTQRTAINAGRHWYENQYWIKLALCENKLTEYHTSP